MGSVANDRLTPEVRSEHWRELDQARVMPASSDEMNLAVRGMERAAERVVHGAPNLFLTMARHPRLFAAWLAFGSQLMPRGALPREDTELVILRVAWNCRCRYEWDQHTRIAHEVGLDDVMIERVPAGPEAAGWSAREAALLAAVDELHTDRMISTKSWERLSAHLDDKLLIELCMLVGHYEMLAMTITSLGIQPEAARPHEQR